MKELICNENPKLCYCNYEPELDPIIENWKEYHCIRVFKGKVFIKHISLGFFIDLAHRLNSIGRITIYTKL